MQVRKLYYEDCLLRAFSATVTACEEIDGAYLVQLDATAFYPEGGGQACDIGTLGDSRVFDVQEKDGRILHFCDKPLTVGESVQGVIDWARRFDLMQQHAGEHILSGIIYQKYGYHNVGFHVGKEVMEVDFDGIISENELAALEAQANEVVWKNVAIQCYTPDPDALKELSYRTKRALDWPVRIVEIPDCDRCACCGIHVASTGQIGLIKIISCTKFHDGVRLEMVCGQRAYDYVCRISDQNRRISRLLSATPLQTADAAAALAQRLEEEKFRANALQSRLLETIADNYKNAGNVLHFEANLSPASVRALADKISAVCGGIAAVCSQTQDGAHLVCLRSEKESVCDLGKHLTQTLGGRGGGKLSAFQGSVLAQRNTIETFFADNF